MSNLLRYEFRKLFHSVSFYVCGGISLFFALLSVYSTSLTDVNTGSGLMFEILDEIGFATNHSGAQFLVEASSNIQYTILIPIIISLFFCSDFADGTIKNIIGRGYSRNQVYFAKLLTCGGSSLMLYFAGMLLSTIYATILWGFGSLAGIDFLSILTQALGIFAYSTMCTLVSVLFRKVAGAVTIGIFINIIFSTLCMVLDLWMMAEGNDVRFSPYLLTTKITDAAKIGNEISVVLNSLLYCVGYGSVFTLCGYLFFRKREI